MTAVTTPRTNVQDLFPNAQRLPPMPPASMNPVLDAASRCFARYGVKRTSVQDVAREMGVNRTTVYRVVGNIEKVAITLIIRDSYRLLLQRAPARLSGPITPEVIIDIMAVAVADARAHPVLTKVLADERELVGSLMAEYSETLFPEIAKIMEPLLAAAIEAGQIEDRDPLVVAEWLVRILASVIVVPPLGDLETFLSTVLIPVLTPGRSR